MLRFFDDMLPQMRDLNSVESEQIRLKLLSSWGIDGSIWAPLVEARPNVEATVFHAAYWEFRDGDAVLRNALAKCGISL